ncbi:hypothetical protein PRZ48_013603 [Zasmidium cellare]|uniref:Luciferase domain-containing protein n=1 Tax=Zasmidium cellare TaxID=395010 RepID=A0ABR0E1J1_ZASCE|nr:hypothetical protein PRZ48_013603 [Zasmidium cellare]
MDGQNSLFRFPRILLSRLSSQSTATNILTATTASAAVFVAFIVSDYRAWKALGTGGSPPTPQGYWRMTKLRLIRAFSFDSLRDASKLSQEGPSYLNIWLPNRTKSRPKTQSRTMPQRQIPVKLDQAVKQRLHALPKKYCKENPTLLKFDLSNVEGRSSDAIYALPNLPNRHPSATDRILKDEIAHTHHAEDSLHVWLSQADARKVVESGWGERFPLSAMGMLHPGLTFVYAPRSMDDVDIIEEIIKAGVAYVTGERL